MWEQPYAVCMYFGGLGWRAGFEVNMSYTMLFKITNLSFMTKINQSNGKFWKAKIYSNDIITMSLLSLFFPVPKKDNAKECSNYCTIALISHASKVMLKILQASFQQYMNHEIPDVPAGFRKGRGIRDQIANIC